MQAVLWNEDFFDVLDWSADQFFVSEGTKIEVVGKALTERLDERFVVGSGVEFLSAEQLFVPEFPGSFKHFHVEKFLELSGYVFEKRESAPCRMLVTESVEYETFFGDEGVAVSWDPVRC